MNRLTGYRSAAALVQKVMLTLHPGEADGLADVPFPPPRGGRRVPPPPALDEPAGASVRLAQAVVRLSVRSPEDGLRVLRDPGHRPSRARSRCERWPTLRSRSSSGTSTAPLIVSSTIPTRCAGSSPPASTPSGPPRRRAHGFERRARDRPVGALALTRAETRAISPVSLWVRAPFPARGLLCAAFVSKLLETDRDRGTPAMVARGCELQADAGGSSGRLPGYHRSHGA